MKLIERKEIFETHKNSASLIKAFQKISIVVILFFLNNSCNQNNNILETKNFDDGQKAITYGDDGIVDSIVFEKKGVKISKFISKDRSKKNRAYKVFFYDKKEKVICDGEMYNNQKIGIWNYFKDKKIIRKEEYVKICNRIVLNQMWNYKSKNGIDYDKSSFYSYKFNDTIFDKEKVEILKVKFYSYKNIKLEKVKFYASSKIKNNFCNIHDLDLFEIQKNGKNEYELAFDIDDNYDTIKGFFIEEIKIDNKIKEKYTFVKIPRN